MQTTQATPLDASSEELRKCHKCVAVYTDHDAAEKAVKELQKSGFDMRKLSIVGKDYHTDEHVVGFYNAGDRVKYWGKLGAFWGGLFGILFAPAFFFIPGVGPVMTGGLMGSALMGMLEGGVLGALMTGGMTAIGAAIFSIGIPKDSVLRYERALKAGKYVLLVHGTAEEAEKARELLSLNSDDVEVHAPQAA